MTQINCIIKTPLKVYQMATTRRSLSIEYEKLADKVRKSVNKEYSLNLHFHSSKKIIGHHYYTFKDKSFIMKSQRSDKNLLDL